MKTILGAALLFASACLNAPTACSDPVVMSFTIKAEPTVGAVSASLSRQFGDDEIATKFPTAKIDVSLTDTDIGASNLSLVWNDETTSQFPIRLAAAFANKNVEVIFFKDPPNDQAMSKCKPVAPGPIRLIFQMYFYCRKAALVEESKRNGKWAPDHRLAMSGWLIASYALYTRGASISPYGFDRDLLDRLNQLMYKVDVERYDEFRFAPLRIGDVRQAIKEVNEEAVRLAGLVPNVIQSGKLDTARVLNDKAASKLEELTKTTGVSNINGVTKKIVNDNAKFIDTLSGKRS